jgi:acetyl esterase/lipase
VVISVNYRSPPEHKFPAAAEDAYAALQDVIKNDAKLNIDSKRVAVGGESAGGNLATVVCLMAKERNGVMPVHQLLINPVTDWNSNRPSLVNRKRCVWVRGLVRGSSAKREFLSGQAGAGNEAFKRLDKKHSGS